MSLEPVDIDIRMRQNVSDESERASRSFDSLTKNVTDGGESINRTLTRLGFGLASTAGFTAFSKNILKVRGDMQMLEVSMETLLGSKAKGDKMVSEVMDYVTNSPYSMMGISKAAETMLGFNVEADKVMSTLKQIGDVSKGNEERLSSLVLAFSQMSATGRLVGQDLNQMINAGFNPLQEMSAKTGKSIAELKKEMEGGAISTEMVADAFASATAEGGRFYNMAAKQASSIKGLESSLTAAFQEMYDDLGKKNEDIIVDGYKMTTALVQNYETIGKAVGALIMTYGAYKAAVVVTNVVLKEQAAINAMVAASNGVFNKQLAYQWVWTDRLQKAHALLNKTMLANPYVLLATVVVGLAAAAWALNDGLTADERAFKKLNEELEAAKRNKEELKGKANGLIAVLRDETATVYQQTQAWKELQRTIPEVFASMSREEFKRLTPDDVQMRINVAMDDRVLEEAKKKIAEAEKNAARIKANLDAAMKSASGANSVAYLVMQLEKAEASTRAAKKNLDEINEIRAEAEFNAKPEAERLAFYEKELEVLKEEQAQLESILLHTESINGEWAKFSYQTLMNVARLDFVNKKMVEMEGHVNGITGKGLVSSAVKNKAYWEKEAADAEKALKAMDVAEKGTTKWSESLKKLKAAQDKLKIYNFSDKVEKDAKAEEEKKRKEAQRLIDINQDIVNNEKRLGFDRLNAKLSNEQALLDLQKDSTKKRLDQLGLDYRREALAIEQHEQQLLEAQQARERKNWEKNGSKDVFTPDAKTTKDLSVEDREAVDARISVNDERLRKSTENLYRELLEKYQDYSTERIAIEEKFNDDLDALRAQRTEANAAETDAAIAEAQRQKQAALSTLDFDQFKKSADWQKMFTDLDNLSLSTLEGLKARLNEVKDANKDTWSAQNVKEFENAVNNLTKTIRTRSPFKAMGEDFKTLLDNISKVDDESKDKATEALGGISDAATQIQGQLNTMAGSIGDIFGDEAGYAASQVAELTGAVADLGKGAAQLMSGDILGGITSIVSSIGTVFSMANKIKERNAAARKEVEDYYTAAIRGEREYQALIRERSRTSKQADRDTLASFDSMLSELERQSGDIQKEYDKIYSKLMGEEYISGKGYKHGTLFRKAKTWDEMSSLSGMSYDDMEKLYMEGNLKDDAKDLFEQLRKLKEEGADVTAMIHEQSEALKEYISGMTFDSLRDSIKDAFSDGRMDIQETADFTRNAFKKAMLQALEAKVLEKTLTPFLESFQTDAMNGTLFEKMNHYEQWIKQIGEEGNAFMESLMLLPGMKDVFAADRKGASAGVETISQDSANAIEGTMYALRISFNDFFNMYKEDADLRSAYLTLLDNLVVNTENCNKELKKILNTLNEISNDGVKIKTR